MMTQGPLGRIASASTTADLVLGVILLGPLFLFASVETASSKGPTDFPESALFQALPTDSLPSVDEIARSFGDDGDPVAGRQAIRAHAVAAPPARATLWIQLLAVTEKVDGASAREAVQAVGFASDGNPATGVELLLHAVAGARPDDRAAMLHLAGLLAEMEDPRAAAEIRRRILEEYPHAPEAPEAMMREARRLLEDRARREEGLELLEELIVSSPDHPIAPEARRLFDRERGRSRPEEAR